MEVLLKAPFVWEAHFRKGCCALFLNLSPVSQQDLLLVGICFLWINKGNDVLFFSNWNTWVLYLCASFCFCHCWLSHDFLPCLLNGKVIIWIYDVIKLPVLAPFLYCWPRIVYNKILLILAQKWNRIIWLGTFYMRPKADKHLIKYIVC